MKHWPNCFVEERWGEPKGRSRKANGEVIVTQARREGEACGLELWPVGRTVCIWEATNFSDQSDATVREKKE